MEIERYIERRWIRGMRTERGAVSRERGGEIRREREGGEREGEEREEIERVSWGERGIEERREGERWCDTVDKEGNKERRGRKR